MTAERSPPPFDQIPAAWAKLTSEQRDEIGCLAITMVFGSFVGGDGYDVADLYLTRKMRDLAEDQGNDALSTLHTRIMSMLPDLFGSDDVNEYGNGGDPPWAWRDSEEYEAEIAERLAEVARLRGAIFVSPESPTECVEVSAQSEPKLREALL